MGGYGWAFRQMRPGAALSAELRGARALLLAAGVGLIGEIENFAGMRLARAPGRRLNTDAEGIKKDTLAGKRWAGSDFAAVSLADNCIDDLLWFAS